MPCASKQGGPERQTPPPLNAAPGSLADSSAKFDLTAKSDPVPSSMPDRFLHGRRVSRISNPITTPVVAQRWVAKRDGDSRTRCGAPRNPWDPADPTRAQCRVAPAAIPVLTAPAAARARPLQPARRPARLSTRAPNFSQLRPSTPPRPATPNPPRANRPLMPNLSSHPKPLPPNAFKL